MKSTILLAAIVALITGCASLPEDRLHKDVNGVERKDLELSDYEMDRRAYIARHLLRIEEQNDLIARLAGDEFVKEHAIETGAENYLLHSVSGPGLGTDIALGQMAIGAVSFFGQVGSRDYISGVALPATFKGVRVRDAEHAWELAVAHTEHQIFKAAESLGYTAECYIGCDSHIRSYLLHNTSPGLNSGYLYEQEGPIVVNAIYRNLVAAEPDVLRDTSLGFSAAWTSEAFNSWVIVIGSTPRLDENGDYLLLEIEEQPLWLDSKVLFWKTEEGGDLMSAIYNDGGYMWKGNGSDATRSYLTYDGLVAYFGVLPSDTSFFQWELVWEEPKPEYWQLPNYIDLEETPHSDSIH